MRLIVFYSKRINYNTIKQRNMKKQLILLCSIILTANSLFAQKSYKLAKTSGHLSLNLTGAIVEGYSGNEIIFSLPTAENVVEDERAKGLRVINGSGFTDNTGLGLDVTVNGEEIVVNSVTKDRSAILTVKVPQNIKVSFKNASNVFQAEVILKNLKNEIDVSTSYNKIKLENNTGPMNIKTLYGSVDAVFPSDIKGPVSIVSVYGYVDVSLAGTTKANVELSTSYGKIYAAEGLKIAVEKTSIEKSESNNSGSVNLSDSGSGYTVSSFTSGRVSDNIKGKINGGGADLILKSSYKNVYLREK
jgi:hypothetical protein